MNALALPIAFMVLIVFTEALAIRFIQQKEVDWRDVIFNLNSGHIVLWLFRGIEVAIFGVITNYYSLDWISKWPVALQWIFAFFAWDFCYYWLHRLHHKFKILWAVHVVHHEGEQYNLSLGVRNSWYSSITSIPFFLILAFMGLPLVIFITISTLHYTIQLFNHNGVTPKLGILEKFMVTPTHHKVHHGIQDIYIDKNFGGSLVIWDKLFGTFQHYRDDIVIEYGVLNNSQPSKNPLLASTIPLLRYFRLPMPKVVISDFMPSTSWLITGTLLLYAVVISYIHHEGQWPVLLQAVLFIMLVLGTVALGGLSEGKKWAIGLWLSNLFLIGLLCVFYNSQLDFYSWLIFLLVVLHSLALTINRAYFIYSQQ